jgi:uncharacterized protein YjbJ (UPF0337 family)
MNRNVFDGKKKQARGHAKVWFGNLKGDNMETISGKLDTFIGLLQEKYGYTQQQVEESHKNRAK